MQKKMLLGLIVFVAVAMVPLVVEAACAWHNITGFVWSRNSGWISLNCNSGGDDDYGIDIDFVQATPIPVTGYAWSSNMGWLDFQPSGPYPELPNHSAWFERNEGVSATSTAGAMTGWAKWVNLGDDGWMKLGPIDISSTDYGIQIGADRLFTGWSWNGGSNIDADSNPERGDGWVDWDSVTTGGGATILAYWYETLYGDIYAGSEINAPFSPPVDRYTATYLIQAGGTIRAVAIQSDAGTGVPYISEGHDSFVLPDEGNDYRGTLGWLDKAGMLGSRYGTPESALPAGSNIYLDGKIYHYSSGLTLNNALTFMNGTGNQKGSGTIIVDGDLTINANLSYQSGPVSSRIDNLPSVAWIVSGSIYIAPTVTEVVGVFYSEDETPDVDSKYGIRTGTTGWSTSDEQLIIRGMFIATEIHLERLFINVDEGGALINNDPAEQFFFDGRALANPPPGLADIGKGLPTLREARP